MTERLGLGGRMSRIDAIAHILNTAGSEGDGQPYSEARLPALADDLDLLQQPKDLKQVTGGGVNARKRTQSQGLRRDEEKGGGRWGLFIGGVHRGWETEPGNPF